MTLRKTKFYGSTAYRFVEINHAGFTILSLAECVGFKTLDRFLRIVDNPHKIVGNFNSCSSLPTALKYSKQYYSATIRNTETVYHRISAGSERCWRNALGYWELRSSPYSNTSVISRTLHGLSSAKPALYCLVYTDILLLPPKPGTNKPSEKRR